MYQVVGDLVSEWGKDSIGEYGYSAVGAVVGATYPEQGTELRKRLPHTFFLVPGYGAQGAKGEDLKGCFDEKGEGCGGKRLPLHPVRLEKASGNGL